tara:strand:+ start:1259 stop:2095 length:837 start_codon:yes stop_codon:yes gene_type:complete
MILKNGSLENQPLEGASISSRFKQIKDEGRIALMPFLMAGDPDLATTSDVLLRLQDEGADLIELGIPYSDPLADGPVIQAAASRALKGGTTPLRIFEMLSELRDKLTIPLILFTYSNPLLNRGVERFCDEASNCGVCGLVVPDLPLEEAERISPIAANKGIDLILLVAPTTSKERMVKISSVSKGFTYLVSVTGVTGERTSLEDRVESLVGQLKESSTCPIAVGFGISDSEQVEKVRHWGADGAIVGSALVKRMFEAKPGQLVEEAGNFCRKLREAAG